VPLRTSPSAPSPAQALLAGAAARVTPAHLAMGRAGAGAVMVARPRLLPTAMGVDSATSARVSWVIQMLGARELALGLGTLAALRSPDRVASRAWVAAGVLSDAVDALAVGAAVGRGRVTKAGGGAAIAVAAAAVAIGVRALQQDDADG
jgi:hypothetical protein